MLVVQSINFAYTDFWSPYLVQIGTEIPVSIANVNLDPFLSQYLPLSTFVYRKSYSETDFATTD